MVTVLASLLAIVVATATVSDEGIQKYLEVIENYETGGDCSRVPPTGSAVGCYQINRLAMFDLGLKNRDGTWIVPNEFGIESDEDFKGDRRANDTVMKRYTTLNWRYLLAHCHGLSDLIGKRAYGIVLDPPSVLAGAHLLGHNGICRFMRCGMHETCIDEDIAEENHTNLTSFHMTLLARMRDVIGLDITELLV